MYEKGFGINNPFFLLWIPIVVEAQKKCDNIKKCFDFLRNPLNLWKEIWKVIFNDGALCNF